MARDLSKIFDFSPVHSLAAGIYFYYSLIYLVTRTVFLTIVVAKVHESSQEPLIYLFAVPSYSYCVEVWVQYDLWRSWL